MPLRDVRGRVGPGPPLHFVLRLEGVGPLGAAEWPDQSTDWQRLSSSGFRGDLWARITLATILVHWSFLKGSNLPRSKWRPTPDEPDAEFEKIAAIASTASSRLEGRAAFWSIVREGGGVRERS